MSRAKAVLVRYKSWYIFLASSAKQQRQMTKFDQTNDQSCLENVATAANFFLNFYFKLIAVLRI